jgi:hypothetical protein
MMDVGLEIGAGAENVNHCNFFASPPTSSDLADLGALNTTYYFHGGCERVAVSLKRGTSSGAAKKANTMLCLGPYDIKN